MLETLSIREPMTDHGLETIRSLGKRERRSELWKRAGIARGMAPAAAKGNRRSLVQGSSMLVQRPTY